MVLLQGARKSSGPALMCHGHPKILQALTGRAGALVEVTGTVLLGLSMTVLCMLQGDPTWVMSVVLAMLRSLEKGSRCCMTWASQISGCRRAHSPWRHRQFLRRFWTGERVDCAKC